MSHINTLIPDIYKLVQTKGWFNEDHKKLLQHEVALRIAPVFDNKEHRGLRLSRLGPQCPCALWNSVHHPELAEPLPPWAEFKYMYGHLIEALIITLAKASGHEVVGEQDELTVDGIKGHRDCIIDGCLFDIKSAATRSFQKFKDGSIRNDDSFGYLDQLDAYLVGSADDPLLKVKDKAYLFAVDKQLGHMCSYEHKLRENSIRTRIEEYKRTVALSNQPACKCGTIPDGKSGNVKLDIKASYNPFKYCCFPKLRTFLYASGPVYLTEVKRLPDVPEVNKHGKLIYSGV